MYNRLPVEEGEVDFGGGRYVQETGHVGLEETQSCEE